MHFTFWFRSMENRQKLCLFQTIVNEYQSIVIFLINAFCFSVSTNVDTAKNNVCFKQVLNECQQNICVTLEIIVLNAVCAIISSKSCECFDRSCIKICAHE